MPTCISDTNIIRIAKQKVQTFKSGQIEKYVHQWELLTSDPEILDIVQGAHIDFELSCLNSMFHPCPMTSVSQKRN